MSKFTLRKTLKKGDKVQICAVHPCDNYMRSQVLGKTAEVVQFTKYIFKLRIDNLERLFYIPKLKKC